MSTKDLIQMAWRNLMSRKVRTALTLLGVIIGSTAILVMMSLGYGIQEVNRQMILNMGDLTILNIMPNFEDEKPKTLNTQTLNDLKKIEHVETVTPVYKTQVALDAGRYKTDYVELTAMELDAFHAFNWEIENGQWFNENDDLYVFGGKVAQNFYDAYGKMDEGEVDEYGMYVEPEAPFNPMNTKFDLQLANFNSINMGNISILDINEPSEQAKSIPINVTGVLKKRNDFDVDYSIFTTISNYKNLLQKLGMDPPPNNQFELIKIKIDEGKNVKQIEAQLKNEGYMVAGLTSILEEMEQAMRVMKMIFGGIGAISFLVAAIGITNTMIMSIYERTREIGIMKVIGASIKDIKRLFLVEAGFIGLIGGVLGVIFSLILSGLFNFLSGQAMQREAISMGLEDATIKISIIPIWLIIVSVAFSCAVGIIAGYFPARRAMNLSALDAIRSE